MAGHIAFELNGKPQSVEVAPDTPLLYVLRNELGLNNPHFGCGLAQCGACTVHLDGAPSPARVVTLVPAAAETGTEQDRVGAPSRCTVQAPHCASPQPK